MSKCVNCLKEINEKEVFCLTCHEEVLECAKQQIAELKVKLEEVEGQYAYECECNKQFVECQNENEKLKAENERLKNTKLFII